MNNAERRFLDNITSLPSLKVPKLHRVITAIIIFLVIAAGLILYFTPWIQTAYGTGMVDSLDPKDRTQPINALVDGQVKQWHVKEGQQVKAGEPIVTLIDIDAQRLEKLQSQLSAANLKNQANETAVRNAENNLARQKSLQEQGLVSRKEVEQAEIKVQELRAKAAASVSEINEVSMTLSRQSTQTKFAPVDGTVVRLLSGGVSTFVKSGDILGQFIPADAKRSVRVTVRGLDAPLVKPGAKARLQFEGWPVFQFSGWPGSAIGTFGGEVVYVEPVANATGDFNVWIKPDESDIPWPAESSARLGSRVKAWVLLEEVRLGYEMWRQLNNFPPLPTQQSSSGGAKGPGSINMVMRRLFFTAIALATYIGGSVPGPFAQTQNNSPVQTQQGRQAPTIEALVDSMVNYHPYVQAINEGNYQAAAELEIARSSFDPFIEQKTKSRVSGYYDGTNLTQRFTNPIEDFNASVFGEYRIAAGDFPSYEGYYDTLSAGEASVGVAMSLLQNREIDKRRTELRNAGLATSQWQALATSLINDFVYKGVSEYIAWYESALQIQEVTELLNTASDREKALVTRVEKGDLASIVLTEFKANLLQQRLTLAELKQKRDMHAQMLSFYWRSPNGDMLAINSEHPPHEISWPFWVGNGQLVTLRKALRNHPELDVMKLEQQVVQNKVALADNALLPKLDLTASIARDVGAGSETLEGTETKVGLSFSYPLGNRKAKAERAQLKSKQRELAHKLTSTQQAIVQRFEQALIYWSQAKDIVALQSENAALAKTLSNVERTRFDAGDSDMFVLNARAQNEIKAKIKEIKAKVDLLKAELMLYREAAMLYSFES